MADPEDHHSMNQDPVHILPLVVDGLGFGVREQWLIKDVSFSLGARGRTFIVGPNGAGKSILLARKLVHCMCPVRSRVGAPQLTFKTGY